MTQNLLNIFSRFLFLACLLSAWFLPIFSVIIRDKFDNEKKQVKASVAVMMLLKIFWPNSQVRWLKVK